MMEDKIYELQDRRRKVELGGGDKRILRSMRRAS